jgi:hypothetical protein
MSRPCGVPRRGSVVDQLGQLKSTSTRVNEDAEESGESGITDGI